jgi:hypothetical protein
MRIQSAKTEFDGRDSQRHAEVTLTVKPVSYPARVFRHVDRYDCERWKAAGYPLDDPPYDIRVKFAAWRRSIERQEKNSI